jgi:hypothetical protein
MGEARKNYTETLQSLFDFVQLKPEEIMSMPIKEIRKELAEDGFDVDLRLEMARKQFDIICTRIKLDSAKVRREEIEKEFIFNKTSDEVNISNIKQTIMDFLSTISPDRRQLITAHHRNFENLTDDDLVTLFEDLKLLEEIHRRKMESNEG